MGHAKYVPAQYSVISRTMNGLCWLSDRVINIENDLMRSAPYAGLEWVPGWPRDYPLRNTAGVSDHKRFAFCWG